jgi:hypothetical protein
VITKVERRERERICFCLPTHGWDKSLDGRPGGRRLRLTFWATKSGTTVGSVSGSQPQPVRHHHHHQTTIPTIILTPGQPFVPHLGLAQSQVLHRHGRPLHRGQVQARGKAPRAGTAGRSQVSDGVGRGALPTQPEQLDAGGRCPPSAEGPLS